MNFVISIRVISKNFRFNFWKLFFGNQIFRFFVEFKVSIVHKGHSEHWDAPFLGFLEKIVINCLFRKDKVVSLQSPSLM